MKVVFAFSLKKDFVLNNKRKGEDFFIGYYFENLILQENMVKLFESSKQDVETTS